MQLYDITSSADPRMAAIHSLYMSAFPVEERRPWESLVQLVDSRAPFFRLRAAGTSGCALAGFVTEWRLPGAVYVEHFAVDPALRGSGIGGAIIDDIVAGAGDQPVVVEVELPDANAGAPRRISFYERHGFSSMDGFVYFQPPYAPGLPDVQLMLMTTRPLPDPTAFVIMLHTLVYNQ